MKNKHTLITVFIMVILGFASAIVTYWQTTRMTHLVDYSYQVEIAYRMFRGQVAYRDFMLVLTPGLYGVMALVMMVTKGYTHTGVIFQSIITQVLTVLLSYIYFQQITKNQLLALVFSSILVVCGHAIYPYPVYDILAVLGMMFCLWFSSHSVSKHYNLHSVLLGIVATLPFYTKQNIGLVFLILFCFSFISKKLFCRTQRGMYEVSYFVAGVLGSLGIFVSYLLMSQSLQDFVWQVFSFPRQARDPGSMFHIVLSDYLHVVKNSTPYVLPLLFIVVVFCIGIICIYKFGGTKRKVLIHIWQAIGGSLLSLGMISLVTHYISIDVVDGRLGLTSLWSMVFLLTGITYGVGTLIYLIKKITFSLDVFLPLVIIGTMHSGFLSQSIAGSHYGMWPLLMTLVVWNVVVLKKYIHVSIITVVAIIWTGAAFVYMGWYVITNQFTDYVQMEGPVTISTKGRIAGMATPGPWVLMLEELTDFVELTIKPYETIVFLPGDDPFFAMTNRIPITRCTQWNSGTCDVFDQQLSAEIKKHSPDWLIVKNYVMTPHAYPPLQWIPIDVGYTFYQEVGGNYLVYKKGN